MIGLIAPKWWESLGLAALGMLLPLIIIAIFDVQHRLNTAEARVVELEISLAETQARAAASETALEALALTTARRGAVQAQATQDIETVQSTPEAIADVETVSPAIGSALDLLRARAGNGR